MRGYLIGGLSPYFAVRLTSDSNSSGIFQAGATLHCLTPSPLKQSKQGTSTLSPGQKYTGMYSTFKLVDHSSAQSRTREYRVNSHSTLSLTDWGSWSHSVFFCNDLWYLYPSQGGQIRGKNRSQSTQQTKQRETNSRKSISAPAFAWRMNNVLCGCPGFWKPREDTRQVTIFFLYVIWKRSVAMCVLTPWLSYFHSCAFWPQ